MELKDLIKTTEGVVVLLGLFLTATMGTFWAFPTAIAYVLINVPSLYNKLKQIWVSLKNKIK